MGKIKTTSSSGATHIATIKANAAGKFHIEYVNANVRDLWEKCARRNKMDRDGTLQCVMNQARGLKEKDPEASRDLAKSVQDYLDNDPGFHPQSELQGYPREIIDNPAAHGFQPVNTSDGLVPLGHDGIIGHDGNVYHRPGGEGQAKIGYDSAAVAYESANMLLNGNIAPYEKSYIRAPYKSDTIAEAAAASVIGAGPKPRSTSVKKSSKKKSKEKTCKCESNPVLMPSGIAVSWDATFFIDGLMPLNIQSAYYSDFGVTGPLGWNRLSDLDAWLEKTDDGDIKYVDSDNFPVLFPIPKPTPGTWVEGDTTRNLKLQAGRNRTYILHEQSRYFTFYKFKGGIWRVGKVADLNGNELVYERDKTGCLHSITNPEGLVVLFDYNDVGLRTQIRLRAPNGDERLILTYQYDAAGNMVVSECPYGERIEYGYDENHQRIRLSRNNLYNGEYSYDDNNRLVETKTNGPFNGDRFDYDDKRRIATFFPAGDSAKLQKFYYNEVNNTTATANALGFISRTEFNDEGYVAVEIDPEGNRTEYTYDDDGNYHSITDGEGRTSFFTWDEEGNPEILISPDGSAWTHTYDERGNLEAVEDANRFRTDISNNDQGLPVGVMRHDGLIRQYAYDEHHRLVASKDFNDAKTYFKRDGFGRIIEVEDALGSITRFEYKDQLGQDFWSPYKTIFPDDTANEIKSGDDRSQTSVVVSGKRKARYVHDAFGKLLESTDNKGANLTFHYDNQQNLEKVANQQGREWTFARDGANRIIRETDFDGQIFTYAYDQADRLIETARCDGGRTTYSYDKSGLVTNESVYPPRQREPDSIKYEYDDRGFLIKAENTVSVLEFEYDANGQLTAEISNGHRIESDYDCCGLRSERRVFAVAREEEPEDLLGIADGLRALAEMRGEGASATVGPQLQITQYLYDPLGGLKQITMGEHKPLNIERDLLGRETSRASETGFSQVQTHDVLSQLTGQQAGRWLTGLTPKDEKTSPQQALERRYAWNNFSEPASVSDSKWGESTYQYDERGQVSQTGFGDGFTEKFQYDAAQNIVASLDINMPETRSEGSDSENTAYTQKRHAPGSGKANAGAAKFLNWQSSKGGRVEKARGAKGETISLTYDERGRVSERLVERNGFRPLKWKFVWDGRDRLAHTITPDGHKWAYQYDPFGRRISKTQYILADNDPRPGEPANRQWQEVSQHSFLWDGDVLVWEETSDERTEWHFEPDTFVPLAKRSVSKLGESGGGAGDGSAATNGGAKEARLWYVVTDHLGTPREMLSEDGSLVWAAEYTTWGSVRRLWQADNDTGPLGNFQGHDPNGNPVYSTRVYGTDGNAALKSAENPDEYACPIRFQGQWADEETGLYYNRHRYYDPGAAQYLSPDPIGLSGGLRTHGYVEAPTGWIDPFGLAKKGGGGKKSGNGKKCCCGDNTPENREKLDEALGSNQNSKGIYRFTDSNQKPYVGSATGQTLGKRLKQHLSSGKLNSGGIGSVKGIGMNNSATQQIYNTEASEIARNGGRSTQGGLTSNVRRPPNTGSIADDPNEMAKPSRFDSDC